MGGKHIPRGRLEPSPARRRTGVGLNSYTGGKRGSSCVCRAMRRAWLPSTCQVVLLLASPTSPSGLAGHRSWVKMHLHGLFRRVATNADGAQRLGKLDAFQNRLARSSTPEVAIGICTHPRGVVQEPDSSHSA